MRYKNRQGKPKENSAFLIFLYFIFIKKYEIHKKDFIESISLELILQLIIIFKII